MDLEKVVRELADKKDIEDLITWRFARAIAQGRVRTSISR